VALFEAACEGLRCKFDASGSYDPEGGIVFVAWVFSDGSRATALRPEHTFPREGSFLVRLTARDAGGLTNTTERSVNVTIPHPETIFFGGRGDEATRTFTTTYPLLRITARHDGQHYFSAWLLDDQGNKVDLVVNGIGFYDGSAYVKASPGTYLLDVTADGAWSFEIDQPKPATGQRPPVHLEGVGDAAPPQIEMQLGLARFHIAHEGEHYFSVWLLDSEGNKLDLLANEVGAYDGSSAFRVPSSGVYFLDVSGDGRWTVEVTQ
jgi:PKD repeat protein